MQLTSLDYFNDNSRMTALPLMLWILSHAPHLGVIRIQVSRCLPDIACAMTKLMHLTKLEIEAVG